MKEETSTIRKALSSKMIYLFMARSFIRNQLLSVPDKVAQDQSLHIWIYYTETHKEEEAWIGFYNKYWE